MKGIYILLVRVERDCKIKIGSLGSMEFEKGLYAYVGSAQNNLEKRVARHLSNKKKIHWHIDYLLKSKFAVVEKVFFRVGGKNEECRNARIIMKDGVPIPCFGCSDCKCISHLFRVPEGLNPFISSFSLFQSRIPCNRNRQEGLKKQI